jgi:hypothetical protein
MFQKKSGLKLTLNDMEEEIITSNDELITLIKGGHFFHFCIALAIKLGYRDTIKEKKEVKFSVGDYNVMFSHSETCFVLTHKIYFARIITAYYNEVVFIGDDEDEVINELLTEFEKEIKS